ncbi:MAG TPA: tRNA dihydrouridine synthase DusB [Clostridiales bacterium]|nr:tRNA dihydrouridine synthase DusB [Clostridiales bacterium]
MRIADIQLENNLFLAPMAGITDLPFRLLCKDKGCAMVYTEMVSAKGLHYGSKKTEELLDIHPEEKPVGVQIFGSDPGIMAETAARLRDSEVALIDINMGCPAPKIVKNGEGCSLMLKPKLVREIVSRVVREAGKPVTVKMRKGWDEDSVNALEIALIAQEEGASAVTVHGRTAVQLYSGRADWDIIKKVADRLTIPVIGNGDVFTPQDAKKMLEHTGCQGVMVARGARGNPWIFKSILEYQKTGRLIGKPDYNAILDTCKKHLDLACAHKGEGVAVMEMRKHMAWYVKGLPKAADFRRKVNSVSDKKEMEVLIEEYRGYLANIPSPIED